MKIPLKKTKARESIPGPADFPFAGAAFFPAAAAREAIN
jgi:hypothetical protein